MHLMRLFLSFMLAWSVAAWQPALAADAERGERLFMTAPAAGLLACADCHSDNPVVNNFGLIWSGRNAVSLIQRAVQINTGGMGYFQNHYSASDLADIAGYLGNAPNRLTFPVTPQGATSLAQTVRISASQKQSLGALSLATEGDFVIASSQCPGTLSRFESCTVLVAFRPSGEGSRDGALLITHNGTPTPIRVRLSGTSPTVPRAVASVAPSSLDFGTGTLAGHGARRDVLVSNRSTDPLRVTSLSIDGNDFRWVGGSCTLPMALTTNQSCVVALRFEPRSGGQRSTVLRLVHDGIGGSSTVALSGLAKAGVDERLEPDTPALDFGTVRVGEPSAELTLRVTQRGTATLTSLPTTTSDPRFVLSHNGCSVTLAPGQRCDLRLRFTPTRVIDTSATLTVGSSLRVPLFGVGSDATIASVPGTTPAHAPGLPQPSHRQLDFGINAPSTVALAHPQQLRVRNPLSGPLQWSRIAIAGADADAFSASGSCRLDQTLTAGSECEMAVTLRPTLPPGAARTGQLEATLVLAAGHAEPVLVMLRAWVLGGGLTRPPDADAATAHSLQVAPSGLVFEAMNALPGPDQTIAVRNPGNRALDVPPAFITQPAFVLASSDCGHGERVLLPGETCLVTVRWGGSAASAGGGNLLFGGDASSALSVALRVTEDAAQRSNVGAGGGSAGAGDVFALLLLVAIIAIGKQRARRLGARASAQCTVGMRRGTGP